MRVCFLVSCSSWGGVFRGGCLSFVKVMSRCCWGAAYIYIVLVDSGRLQLMNAKDVCDPTDTSENG